MVNMMWEQPTCVVLNRFEVPSAPDGCKRVLAALSKVPIGETRIPNSARQFDPATKQQIKIWNLQWSNKSSYRSASSKGHTSRFSSFFRQVQLRSCFSRDRNPSKHLTQCQLCSAAPSAVPFPSDSVRINVCFNCCGATASFLFFLHGNKNVLYSWILQAWQWRRQNTNNFSAQSSEQISIDNDTQLPSLVKDRLIKDRQLMNSLSVTCRSNTVILFGNE